MFKALLTEAIGSDGVNSTDETLDEIEKRHAKSTSSKTRKKQKSKIKVKEEIIKEDKNNSSTDDFIPSAEEVDDESDVENLSIRSMIKGSKKRRESSSSGQPRKRIRKLPREMAAIIGEANMEYASGNFEKAITLLKEFIRKSPTTPDPYHTLGMIYEETKEMDKAIEFYLIAATLTNDDASLWRRVGQMAREDGNLDQALYCYRKAVSVDPSDIGSHINRAEMYLELRAYKKAGDVYEKIAELKPKDLTIWLNVAQCFHSDGNMEKALDALKICIDRSYASEDVNEAFQSAGLNAVNMLSDLLITLGKYQEAIDTIEKYHEIMSKTKQQETDSSLVSSLEKNDLQQVSAVPIDIAVKFGVCHIHLHSYKIAETMFTHLFQQPPEEFGDLFIDVADAYTTENEHEKAIDALNRLLCSKTYNREMVWVKLGKNLEKLERNTEALEYYEKAIIDQYESFDLNVDPELILIAGNLFMREKKPNDTIRIVENYFLSLFDAKVRPYENSKRHKKSLNEKNQKEKNKDTDAYADTDMHTATETEFEKDDDDEEEEEEEEDDDDEDEDEENIEFAKDYSPESMPNDIRLKLFIMLAYAYQDIGNDDLMCKMGVPIVICCLYQSSRFMSWNKRTTRNRIRIQLEQTLNLSKLRKLYFIDIKNSSLRRSRIGVIIRCSAEISILKAIGEKLAIQFLMDIFYALLRQKISLPAIEMLMQAFNVCTKRGKKLGTVEQRLNMRFITIKEALDLGENGVAYEAAKAIPLQDPQNIQYWNFFNYVISKSGCMRSHQKFIARQLEYYPHNIPLMIMAGHFSAMNDSTQIAIGEYSLAYNETKNKVEDRDSKSNLCQSLKYSNPLTLLCMGITLINSCMNRMISNRQHIIVKGIGMLDEYAKLRHETENYRRQELKTSNKHDLIKEDLLLQNESHPSEIIDVEIFYNFGRAYHQLGLVHLAIPLYEKVLQLYEESKSKKIFNEFNNLSRETAYNLSLIYQKSGSNALAAYLIQKYLQFD